MFDLLRGRVRITVAFPFEQLLTRWRFAVEDLDVMHQVFITFLNIRLILKSRIKIIVCERRMNVLTYPNNVVLLTEAGELLDDAPVGSLLRRNLDLFRKDVHDFDSAFVHRRLGLLVG